VSDAEFDAQLDAVLIGGREQRDIIIVPYDPAWPVRYERERARIVAAVGAELRAIHHVGSTSVEGLAAKPIIDILLVVRDPASEHTYQPSLEHAGYVLRVREPGHRMFRTPERDVHVHIWDDPADDERHLRFRDRLRQSPADREQYQALKETLAAQDWPDVNYYARAKSALINDIMQRDREAPPGDKAPRPPC
jgi:GrpB-like predicted nucleotidyltransferase (UPF0157 family)